MLNVFGGNGFIGSNYVKDRMCLVNDRNDLTIKSDEILYLISTIDNYNIFTNPYVDIETNLITLIRVLEQCKNKNVIFNFVSSWFVYGDTNCPAGEDDYCNPKGFYSITKRTAEQLLISYCTTFDIKYRILRLANVIGFGDKKISKKKNALQYLINQLKEDKDIDLYNNGDFIRDYIHVSDACRAIELIVKNGKLNQIYNVGNGNPTRFKEIIEYVKNKIGSKSVINSVSQTEFHKNVQVKSFWMNVNKLKELGYTPEYSIFETLDKLIDE